MEVDKCDHFITEGGKCTLCGEPFENPRWTMENILLEMQKPFEDEASFKLKYLNEWENSNIPQISRLAEQTWAEYDLRATNNEEPNCPQRPRLRMLGGRLMRIPFHQIWREVVEPSYFAAQTLGYLGDYRKWEALVKDSCPPEPRRHSS
jgi:hypothetical protein